MPYRMEQILRLLALAGMLTLAISIKVGWDWGIVLGALVWVILLPVTIAPFAARAADRFLPTDLSGIWRFPRLREKRVPRLAVTLAHKLNISPPRVMKVIPGSHINAAVKGKTLWITEGLLVCLWTRVGEGVMAHEIAHLAGKHHIKKHVALFLTALAITATITMIDNYSWAVLLAVTLTILAVSFPILSRHFEYDADRRAASIVGSETVTHTLRNMEDRSFWSVESDTHPSIERRLVRLQGRAAKNRG